MKKTILAFLLPLSLNVAAQTVQAVIVNTGASKVSFYCIPDAAISNVILSNITVVISIPHQVTNPTITVTGKYGFTGMAWIAADNNANAEIAGHNAPYDDGTRAYYTFYGNDLTASYTTPTNWSTAGGKYPVADFTFSDRTGITDAQIHIDDLSSGGWGSGSPTGKDSYWYLTQTGIGDVTNTTTMFLGAGASNNGGSTPSFSPLQPLSFLPLAFQEFNVTKQGTTGALLTWKTTQEQNVSHFILERSISQASGWTRIGEVKAKGNTNYTSTYTYLDQNAFDGRTASKVIFYRIRSIDLDASEKIFPIRSLKFTAEGKEISIYPNPAKEGFTISIPIVNPGNKMIRLNMVNRLGQVVHAREIPAASASNYYYDIKTPGIVTGEYMLQIIYDGALLDTKKVIVQL